MSWVEFFELYKNDRMRMLFDQMPDPSDEAGGAAGAPDPGSGTRGASVLVDPQQGLGPQGYERLGQMRSELHERVAVLLELIDDTSKTAWPSMQYNSLMLLAKSVEFSS